MNTTAALLPAVSAALEAYGEALNAHGWDWDTRACKCGEAFTTSRYPMQAVGRHTAAARRRAVKVYDAACTAAIAVSR